MFTASLLLLAFKTVLAPAAPLAAPTVALDSATFTGATSGSVSKFLGIPFAQPPVGDLRFRLPQPIPAYNGTYTVTSFGPTCPQQAVTLPIVQGLTADGINFIVNSIFGAVRDQGLTINVFKPATATRTSKLPVVAWIFGGGFELGSSSMYDGSGIVSRFGFMAGKEVKEAGVGNLGLQDQRQALRWIQKYIGQFGGDPTKVTIWGESAGAISVALHMVANNGNSEGLFRAGFMESGAPIPVGDITNGQKYYDAVVSETGCIGTSDTLQCLREVPYAQLKAAINKSPSLILAWLPRADGVFLTDNPQRLVQQGKIANVPFVTGIFESDFFSVSTYTCCAIRTESQLKDYIKTTFLPGTTDTQIDKLAILYPGDITQGSPFDTGILNALTPQFKRFAAFQGDGVFQAPRRFFLEYTVGKQDSWVFLSKRLKSLPVLGSLHASDLLNIFGGGELADYLIRFAAKLNPNPSSGLQWPKYDLTNRKLMVFRDGLIIDQVIGDDTYRQEAMDYLTNITLQNPI
ncbi:carotenoid ester lipase precursor [Cyathus striatus]|nr:carotenoid ester lipase precursor [Cyathus striatus]